jgi:hypothetical protein
MPRIVMSAGAVMLLIGFALSPALAQSSGGGKPAQSRQYMETPISSEQQAAAKQADCRKEAKAQKLSGAKRRSFLRDCTK